MGYLHWLYVVFCSFQGRQSNIFLALQSTIEFEKGFTATSILHPATYLNKVLIASNEGDMELWNIASQCVESCHFLPTGFE
jgi:hypothetical protein